MRLCKLATALLSCCSFHSFAADITPSFDYRFDFKSDDLGMHAGDDSEIYRNQFSLSTARLSLKAELDKQTAFKARYNLTKQAIEETFVTRTLETMPVFALIGMKKAYQGGYFQKKSSTLHLIGGAYLDSHKPLGDSYVPMIEIGYKISSSVVGLQLVNDITTANKGVHNDRRKQPAWIAHADINMKPFTSWVQYGAYDNNKSHFVDFSLGFSTESLNLAIDYIYDSRDVDVGGSPTGTKPMATRRDVFNSLHVDLEYSMAQTMLFLQAAQFTRKQAGTDLKANSTPAGAPKFDDNADEIGLGIRATGFGKAFVPYVGFVARQADFFKAGTTDEEQKLNRIWIAGITGDIQ